MPKTGAMRCEYPFKLDKKASESYHMLKKVKQRGENGFVKYSNAL
jgi:hypothetical protein